jgi:hypothetical protein
VEKLLNGRIDTFIGEEWMVKFVLKRKGLENAISMAPYRFSRPQDVFITLSRQSQFLARADEFSGQIKAMKEEKVIEKLSREFIKSITLK